MCLGNLFIHTALEERLGLLKEVFFGGLLLQAPFLTMSSDRHETDSRKRHSLDDENLGREVYLRRRKHLNSMFSDNTMFESRSLEEPTNIPRSSISVIMDRMIQNADQANRDPPQAPAESMEMDAQEVELVDYDTIKIPHPDFLFVPQPFSASCLLKLCGSGTEYGHFNPEDDSGALTLFCRVNHGHMAEPSINIRLRKAKNNKGPVDAKEPNSFMDSHFFWAPGVPVGRKEDGSIVYQLQDCTAYTMDQYENLGVVKDPVRGGRSILSTIAPEVRNRLVLLHIKGNNARIEAFRSARGSFNNGATKDVKTLVDSLFTKPHVDFVVAVLIHEHMGMTAKQWIEMEFNDTLKKHIEERTIPMAPYFKDGNLNTSLDMPSIKSFANRMLCRLDAQQFQAFSEALVEDETSDKFPEVYRVPDPASFAKYPATREYSMTKLWAVPHAVTVVHEYQWQDGEYRRLPKRAIEFQVVRTFRAKSKPVKNTEQRGPARSAKQIQQETSFYLCEYLPPGCPQPLEGSQWLIN